MMRKTIYIIGSIFLVIGLVLVLFMGKFLIGGGDDPYNLSESEFLDLYKNKNSYSYAYSDQKNDVIFICLDRNSRKEDRIFPKCKGYRRYVRVSKLDKALAEKILNEIK